jgi:hypothetical protein
MTASCNYRHELSADYFDDESSWDCPHPADENYCVFHGEASDEARRRRFIEAVEEPAPATNQFALR